MKNNKQKNNILIIHGPNLNMLGTREQDIYGKKTLEEINSELKKTGEELGLNIQTYQSNHEGDIVDKIQESVNICNGIIINPAAYTHTSIAIRDALLILNIPVIEIHLSNIYKRESFRQKSLIADIVTGQISGFGYYGYIMALRAIAKII